MRYERLTREANRACADLVKVFTEEVSAPRDRGAAISSDIAYWLFRLNEPVHFWQLRRWHIYSGRFCVMKSLFVDWLEEKSVGGIGESLSEIRDAFARIREMGRLDQFDEVLKEHCALQKDMYLGISGTMIDSVSSLATANLNSVETMYDEIEESLLEPRWVAEMLYFGSVFLQHPSWMAEWIKDMRTHDADLTEVLRAWYRRFHELKKSWGVVTDRRTIMRDRFVNPPEVFPWSWVNLEEQEKRPLHEVFEFDPREVKKKLENIDSSLWH